MNPHMMPKLRSEEITRATRDMHCTLRLASFAGLPCSCEETLVPCHLPVIGKGMGTKVTDLAVVAGCQVCHDLLDGRDPKGIKLAEMYPGAWSMRLLNALVETQAVLLDKGIIEVPGGKVV